MRSEPRRRRRRQGSRTLLYDKPCAHTHVLLARPGGLLCNIGRATTATSHHRARGGAVRGHGTSPLQPQPRTRPFFISGSLSLGLARSLPSRSHSLVRSPREPSRGLVLSVVVVGVSIPPLFATVDNRFQGFSAPSVCTAAAAHATRVWLPPPPYPPPTARPYKSQRRRRWWRRRGGPAVRFN